MIAFARGHLPNQINFVSLIYLNLTQLSTTYEDSSSDFICHFTHFILVAFVPGSYRKLMLILILRPGRLTTFGTFLVICGLVKEGILRKPENTNPLKASRLCMSTQPC